MKITLKISLVTDGDFSLPNFKQYDMEWDGTGYWAMFVFTEDTLAYNFEDEHDTEMSPRWRACNLLEKMICDIHVSYTHHYLIKDLYDMFEEALCAVGQDMLSFETSISGNYEGTFIEVYCKR